MADHSQEFRISLFTHLKGYSVEESTITVPATATRAQLSKLVNELLELEKPLPFDFIIQEEFLRSTLGDVLRTHNLPSEEEIPVEYILALLPPKPHATSSENDWISGIDIRTNSPVSAASPNNSGGTNLIASSSYDGLGRLYDEEANVKTTLQIHVGPVRDIAFINRNDALQVVTCGQDEVVALHHLNPTNMSTKEIIKCVAHKASVSCVASRPDGTMVCSGGHDNTIRLWASEPERDDLVIADKKKRKDAIPVFNLEDPLLTLNAAIAAITSVIWPENDLLFSGSEDHAIKSWDIVKAVSASSLTGPKVVTHIDYCCPSRLLAAAGFDGSTRLYNTANNAIHLSSVMTCHQAPISCLSWNPKNEYQFVTGSLCEQTNMRVWDIRSHRTPVCGIPSHKEK
eukprot:gene8607-10292_t